MQNCGKGCSLQFSTGKKKELRHKVDEQTHQLNKVYSDINSAKSASIKQLGCHSDVNQGSLFDDQTIPVGKRRRKTPEK